MHIATLLKRYTSDSLKLKTDDDVMSRMRTFFTLKYPVDKKLLVPPGLPSFFVELTEELYDPNCTRGSWQNSENLERRLIEFNDLCGIRNWKVEPALKLFDTHHSNFKLHLAARLNPNPTQQALLLPKVSVDDSPIEDESKDDLVPAEDIEQALIASGSGRTDFSQRNAPSVWSPGTQISRPNDARLPKKKTPKLPRHPLDTRAPAPSPAMISNENFENHLSDLAQAVEATGNTALIQQFQIFSGIAHEAGFCGVLTDSPEFGSPSESPLTDEASFCFVISGMRRTLPRLSDNLITLWEYRCVDDHAYLRQNYWTDMYSPEQVLWGSFHRYERLILLRNELEQPPNPQAHSRSVGIDIRATNTCFDYWNALDPRERDLWESFPNYSNLLRHRYSIRHPENNDLPYVVHFFGDQYVSTNYPNDPPLYVPRFNSRTGALLSTTPVSDTDDSDADNSEN